MKPKPESAALSSRVGSVARRSPINSAEGAKWLTTLAPLTLDEALAKTLRTWYTRDHGRSWDRLSELSKLRWRKQAGWLLELIGLKVADTAGMPPWSSPVACDASPQRRAREGTVMPSTGLHSIRQGSLLVSKALDARSHGDTRLTRSGPAARSTGQEYDGSRPERSGPQEAAGPATGCCSQAGAGPPSSG